MSADWNKVFDVMADNIVNPKCDECGSRLDIPPRVAMMGPHECAACRIKREREMIAEMRDRLSQERPRGRTVHKMPKLDWL